MTTYSSIWACEMLHRYDNHAPDGVGNRHHQNDIVALVISVL